MFNKLVDIGKFIVFVTIGAAVAVYLVLLIKGVQSAAMAIGAWN